MRKFHVVDTEFRFHEDVPDAPRRATKGSAGYDFSLVEDVIIPPNESILIWTDIKAEMNPRDILQMHIRSSYGIKKSLMLKNIVGLIDSDYYQNPSNDGNIGIALYNYGKETVNLEKGEAFCQGVFSEYLITDNDNTYQEREGGMGSTSK